MSINEVEVLIENLNINEKNKKVKKCIHNRDEYRCKLCKGKGICEHNNEKYYCKECPGKGICEHKIRKNNCKKCKGSGICQHDNIKRKCKFCKGDQICEHNFHKWSCKQCNGNLYCKHNKQKRYCIECDGKALCVHKKDKYYCRECCGNAYCIHNIQKCYCKECGGSLICEHDKQKRYCKICGGERCCKSENCETSGNPKYDNYCLNCFIHKFPEKINQISNYRTKENNVSEYLLEFFKNEKLIINKKIYDGISKRRPDIMFELKTHNIIIEIDEDQHQYYECICENKRIMEISQDLKHKPIIFIRFNPDNYIDNNGNKVNSCWTINKQSGILFVCSENKKQWEIRLEILKTTIQYYLDNEIEQMIDIIYLFYDGFQNINNN
jgi:hypothetical protein